MNLNVLFTHKKNGRNFIQLIDQEASDFLSKDFESLRRKSFRWGDIEIPAIDQRISLLEILNQVMPRIAKPLIYTGWVNEYFPLYFIDLITEYPDYSFGHPLYIKSQIFYTHFLEIFGRLYLEKDFELLDKIDAQDMGTYTPIARHYIRRKNLKNQYIHDKYFNKEFNLHRFTMKMVDKFIPGATWRWIEDKHKVHIHAVKWCKILMEYCLISDDEIEEIFHALYLKIQTFKFLELSVNEESGKLDDKIVNAWGDGLRAIREYYCEIFVLYLFMKQDDLVVSMMKKVYGLGRRPNERELKEIFDFNKMILFEEEFGRKMMDVLFSYILSQNLINKKVITSRKIEDMVTNLMYSIANTNDIFLESLKNITDDDYENFCREIGGFNPPREYLEKDFRDFYGQIKNIQSDSMNGFYLYKEQNLIKDLENILDQLDLKFRYTQAIKDQEPRNLILQRVIFDSDFQLVLSIIMSNYAEYSNHFTELPSETLFQKYTDFLRFYLNKHLEAHCTFFVEVGYWSIENMFYKHPEHMSSLIYDIKDNLPNVVMTKEYLLDVTHDMFIKYLKTTTEAPNVKGWRIMSKVTDIVKVYTRVEYLKIFHWIPEYDVRIVMEMMNIDQMRVFAEYERLLKAYNSNPDPIDNAKCDFYMNFLSLIRDASAFRYVQSSFKKMNEAFSVQRMINLIPLAGDNLKFRSILFDIYSVFHIDFKNHLINNRTDYYHTRPKDMQYEEDPYVDHFYDLSIDLFISEITYLMDRFDRNDFDEKEYFYHFNSSILGSIVKLMNYYFVIRESDLEKINKYIPNLENLLDFLYKNRLRILLIFSKNIKELESPTKMKMEVELAKIDTKFKLKREKLQIVGLSKSIFELCEGLMIHRPLTAIKKSLLSKKPSIDRIKGVIKYYETFSTTLSIKKKHLDLPFERINNGKARNIKGEIPLMAYMIAHYEHYKMAKMSVDAKSNIYLMTLNEKKQESQNMSQNLCHFFHNQLKRDWYIDKKNLVFSMIEALCNFLFISTNSIQTNFHLILTQQPAGEDVIMMNSCWSELKWYMSYIKFKTNIDKIWKETYRRVLLLIKFHQFLCEDNCLLFKEFFATKTLKADTIDRTQRFTTIFQKLSDNFQWHYNYEKGCIDKFTSSHRSHLFVIATGVFENLAELCTGPNKMNQMKVYTLIFDRYVGLLKRYCQDTESEFYRTKLALIDFFMTLIEGLEPDILTYQVTNLELSVINTLMIDSLKQAFFCIVKKDPFDKKRLDDYKITMADYEPIINAFQTNLAFAKHSLVLISLRLFTYIKTMGEAKSKYDIFCKEREEMLSFYEKNGKINGKNTTEEDLVTYKFVRNILIKIEIKQDKNSKLTHYYFPNPSSSFFLSNTSKEKFLQEVDRSSTESKLSGFINYTQYFQLEMSLSQNRFRNKLKLYRYLSGNLFFYIETFAMMLSIINNLILLISFRMDGDYIDFHIQFSNTVLILGLIEIVLAFFSLIMNLYMNYRLTRAITRQKYLDTHAGKTNLSLFDKIYVDIYLSLLSQQNFFVNSYHIIFVGLGISTSYGFISIDILAIIGLFPTMQYIIKSVTEHLNQLFLTLVLAAVMMFAYGIFVHMYFVSDLEDAALCSTLSHCYFTIIDKAFRDGQGIGTILGMGYYGNKDTAEGGDVKFYASLFVNLSFFLFINIVLLNIILAILVDTFSGLREKSEKFSIIFYIFK